MYMRLYYSTQVIFIDLSTFYFAPKLHFFFLFVRVFWFCPITWIYTVGVGTHLKYKCKNKKTNKQETRVMHPIAFFFLSCVLGRESKNTEFRSPSLPQKRQVSEGEGKRQFMFEKQERERQKKAPLETCHVTQMIP